MENTERLISIIKKQDFIMKILHVARDLNIPNWYLGAGTIRNTIWDILSFGKIVHRPTDIDIPFFDANNTNTDYEKNFETLAQAIIPEYAKWEIKNNARSINGRPPQTSVENAISLWPETATTVSIRLLPDNSIKIFYAETGLDDLFNMIVRPTKNAEKEVFEKRYNEKRWLEQWPNLRIVEIIENVF